MTGTPPSALKMAIFASGISQRDLAAKVGLHETQLSRIANGLHAPEATQAAIADALGREISELWPQEVEAR